MPDTEIDKRVRAAADKLNLTSFLKRKPAALSGGQRQRVAIGRAIVRNPDVFLFDEPLSNLDAKLRGSMRITIGQLHKELNATIVYVTHDQVEAMTLADKIIVLDGGHIQQMGTPLDLYYHPNNRFVARFIGSPPMNMIRGELADRGEGLEFVSTNGLTFKLPPEKIAKLKPEAKPGLKVDWGIRAENFRAASDVDDAAGLLQMSAVAEVVEPLGPTTAVYCKVRDHDLHITLNEPHRPRVGDTIELVWKSKHFYLFDVETGAAVTN